MSTDKTFVLELKLDNMNVWFRTVVEGLNAKITNLNGEVALLKKQIEDLQRDTRRN